MLMHVVFPIFLMFLNCPELAEQREEQILNCNSLYLEDGVTYENQEEAIAMIDESPAGAEITTNQSGMINITMFGVTY